MIADYFTKPLQGALFRKFRDLIMGIDMNDYEQYRERYLFLSIGRKAVAFKKAKATYDLWAGRVTTLSEYENRGNDPNMIT